MFPAVFEVVVVPRNLYLLVTFVGVHILLTIAYIEVSSLMGVFFGIMKSQVARILFLEASYLWSSKIYDKVMVNVLLTF